VRGWLPNLPAQGPPVPTRFNVRWDNMSPSERDGVMGALVGMIPGIFAASMSSFLAIPAIMLVSGVSGAATAAGNAALGVHRERAKRK